MALKQDFAASLRSGEFAQITTGVLRNAEGMCALGVLGNVLAKREQLTEIGKDMFFERADYLLQFIPSSVADQIAVMNDAGTDFFTIANWVESNLTDELKLAKLQLAA